MTNSWADMREEQVRQEMQEDELHAEIERLREKLRKIAEHPDVPMLIRQYAAGKLD